MPSNLYRRGKTWWVRVQVRGKEIRRSLRTKSRAEAVARLGDWLRDINQPAHTGKVRALWQQAVLCYLTEFMPGNVGGNTQIRYRVSLRQVDEFLSGSYVDTIDEVKISEVIIKRRLEHEASNATIRRDLTAIGHVLRAAKAKGWCMQNAAATYDRELIKELRDPITLPTDAEVDAAIACVPPMMGYMMRAAEKSGMRQNEIVTLEHGQLVSLPNGTRQIRLIKTKTRRPRTIRLEGPLLGELSSVLESIPTYLNGKFFFWHGEGNAYRNFASNYAAQKNAHEFTFRFHDLRHKFAVDYLRLGGNIYDLQRIMGHSSIKTTELYLLHLDPEERRIAEHGTGFYARSK